MTAPLAPSVSDILCAGFSLPGSGCLSGSFSSRYLMSLCPVFPAALPNRAYRALPGLMLRVLVFLAFPAWPGAASRGPLRASLRPFPSVTSKYHIVMAGWRDTPFFRGMRDRHVQVLMAYDMGRFLP